MRGYKGKKKKPTYYGNAYVIEAHGRFLKKMPPQISIPALRPQLTNN